VNKSIISLHGYITNAMDIICVQISIPAHPIGEAGIGGRNGPNHILSILNMATIKIVCYETSNFLIDCKK
jgi:hypothetical protein